MKVMAEKTHGPVVLRAVACECGAMVCQSAFVVGSFATADCWVTIGSTSAFATDTLEQTIGTVGHGEALETLHKACAVVGQPWAQLTADNDEVESAMWRMAHLDPGLVGSTPVEQCWAARRAAVGSDPLRVVRILSLVASSYVAECPVAAEDLG